MKKLLIMGGGRDVNVHWVERAAKNMGVDYDACFINPELEPCFEWDLSSEKAVLNGKDMNYCAAFMRYDVFSGLYTKSEFANENAANWYAAFSTWCQLNSVRMLNQTIDPVSGSKIGMLVLARKHGFEVPETCVSNSKNWMETLGDMSDFIAKPISGGSYCVSLDDAVSEAEWNDGIGASPALIQRKLMYPEFRVYRVGDAYFAFNIDSETLDSRLDKEGKIVPINISSFPQDTIESLRSLTDEIGCDFCAIDLKTDPVSEQLVFLELNNGPMFMGYDKTINGAMAQKMVSYLMSAS